MTMRGLSDAELARAAQSGDAGALGALIVRHQAGMRAVALSLLGPGPDGEDAVQDAVLVALWRIGDVRNPEAVGAWLWMIVRNACRDRLRSMPETSRVEDLPSCSSHDRHAQALQQQSHVLRGDRGCVRGSRGCRVQSAQPDEGQARRGDDGNRERGERRAERDQLAPRTHVSAEAATARTGAPSPQPPRGACCVVLARHRRPRFRAGCPVVQGR